MKTYILSYDLRKVRNYARIIEELEAFQAVRILESVWSFKVAAGDVVELRDYFKRLLDSDDGLFVAEIGAWASSKAESTPRDIAATGRATGSLGFLVFRMFSKRAKTRRRLKAALSKLHGPC